MKLIISLLGMLLISFGLVAFIELELNALNWHWTSRAFFGGCIFIIVLLGIGVNFEK